MTLKIVERGGLKIGILGILGNRSFKYYPKEISNAITLHDPVTTVKNLLKKIREKVDVVLVLSHQGFDQDVSLARQLKEIDIIIGAHSQTVVHDPKEENGVLITQAGKDGHYVGVIKIQMEKMSSNCIDIPIIIGGREIRTNNLGKCIMPHNHQHILQHL